VLWERCGGRDSSGTRAKAKEPSLSHLGECQSRRVWTLAHGPQGAPFGPCGKPRHVLVARAGKPSIWQPAPRKFHQRPLMAMFMPARPVTAKARLVVVCLSRPHLATNAAAGA
jgi:hypothetical protein